MILDTSFLIALMKKDPAAVKKLEELEDLRTTLHVAAPTIFELYVGITISSKPEREKKRVVDTITSLGIYGLEERSAAMAGEVQGALIKAGKMIDPEDAMIAGIALVYNEVLLTRNAEHFARVPNLKLEEY
jgi:predicted nucleic acid-binding protein